MPTMGDFRYFPAIEPYSLAFPKRNTWPVEETSQ